MTLPLPHLTAPYRNPVIVGGAFEATPGLSVLDAHRQSCNAGNTGNLAFSVAIRDAILDGEAPAMRLHERGLARQLGDVAVMPCANFLSEEPSQAMASRAQLIAQYGLPAVAIGLGAQAHKGAEPFDLHPDSRTLVDALISAAPGASPSLWVRGEYTWQVLQRAGLGQHAEVLGCPSLFLASDPQLGRSVQRQFDQLGAQAKAAVSGWSRSIPVDVERKLTGLAESTGGIYVAQHPADLVYFATGQFGQMDERMRVRIQRVLVPGRSGRELAQWVERHGRAFFHLAVWRAALRSCDFFIGGRIHGAMIALQAGRPAICIVHDSRTLELCELMAVPHVHIEEVEAADLSVDQFRRWFNFDPDHFDHNRRILAQKASQFLIGNGIDLPYANVRRLAQVSL